MENALYISNRTVKVSLLYLTIEFPAKVYIFLTNQRPLYQQRSNYLS